MSVPNGNQLLELGDQGFVFAAGRGPLIRLWLHAGQLLTLRHRSRVAAIPTMGDTNRCQRLGAPRTIGLVSRGDRPAARHQQIISRDDQPPLRRDPGEGVGAQHVPQGYARGTASITPPAEPGQQNRPPEARRRLAQYELHRQSLPV